MKKEIEQILKKRIKRLDLRSMGEFEYEAQEFTNKEMSQVLSYIEELEKEKEVHLSTITSLNFELGDANDQLKRIEKVYEQDINTPMPSDKLEELKCIKSYFQIKSILEEGVDQDENN